MSDVRVENHIFRSPNGRWRVVISRAGRLYPKRFPPNVCGDAAHQPQGNCPRCLIKLRRFIAVFNDESVKLKAEAAAAKVSTGFTADAHRYLALKVVKAMPDYLGRKRDMERWMPLFGTRDRTTITAQQIDEHLQAWIDEGYAASTVNKRRSALQNFYTKTNGKAGANPVRDSRAYPEPDPGPCGLPSEVVDELLAALPQDLSQPVKGVKGGRLTGSKAAARLGVWAATGMPPAQIKLLEPKNINLKDRWYISPRRIKGRRPRTARAIVAKRMSQQAHDAFVRFMSLGCWGKFDARVLGRAFTRAKAKVERAHHEYDPTFSLAGVTPNWLRHSVATDLLANSGNLGLVTEMLDHSTPLLARRYALGAVAPLLAHGIDQMAAGREKRRVAARAAERKRRVLKAAPRRAATTKRAQR